MRPTATAVWPRGRALSWISLARSSSRRGVGKIVAQPYRPDGGDLDLDASFDVIAEATAARAAVDFERLRVRSWSTPDTALCLLVDRSGSMGGQPLATAAIIAAAVALRGQASYSVVAFGKDVVAVKSQRADKRASFVPTPFAARTRHEPIGRSLRAAGANESQKAERKITPAAIAVPRSRATCARPPPR